MDVILRQHFSPTTRDATLFSKLCKDETFKETLMQWMEGVLRIWEGMDGKGWMGRDG